MEKVKNGNSKIILSALKGALISVCVSLLSILVFAFIIKLTGMSDALIKPINQIIKALSIFLGTYFIIKKTRKKGLLTGVIVGLLYTILAFVIFSILNGSFSFDITLLFDVIFGTVMGAICGIICVNLTK